MCCSACAQTTPPATPPPPHTHQPLTNQTKPNQTKPNQTKPNQTKPNQTHHTPHHHTTHHHHNTISNNHTNSALARKNGHQLAYNQEIVGLGLANFAGAAFSAYTTTGSFSRSAVNNASGARTQLAGFVTSVVVMLVLLFATPVFAKLPYNTIAAIIIVGVAQLVEFPTALYLFRTHLRDFVVWVAAFVCTLFLGAELGLGISIGLALLIVVLETAFPHTAVLGRVERTAVYRNVEQYPSSELTPGVLVARLDAPVYFANCQWMQDKLDEYEREARA